MTPGATGPPAGLHGAAVDLLRGWAPPSRGQERLRDRYLACLARDPLATTREGHPEHLTASTLVLSDDGRRVLLTLHAKAREWFQLGGHCEPGDSSLLAAARREALEESGITDLRHDPVPLRLDEHAVPFCGPTGEVRHLDVWFLAVAANGSEAAASEESLDVRWWPVDDLPVGGPAWDEALRLAASRRLGQSTSSSGGGSSLDAADHPSR